MGAINLPYNIQNGDALDADKVMADLQSIITQANGLLEADNNVQVLAPPNSNTGNSNSEGTSAFLSRADHQHVIQGVENVTTLPVTGNFLGRLVYVTSGVNIGKLMCCTDAGANTFVGVGGTLATSDVAVHAVEHKDGGHDPLADNTITDHMHAAKTNIFAATLGSAVNNISTAAYTTILDLTTVTTTGLQTLLVLCNLTFQTAGTTGNVAFRLVDVTAGNVTIGRSPVIQLPTGNVQTFLAAAFYYTVPAGGARTLRIQAGAAQANTNVITTPGFNGDATAVCPNISAVII